jgi:protein tyrosine phosphatase type 4A
MSRLVRPEHSEIAFKELRFLITDRPNDALMDRFIEELRRHKVSDVVRVCEPSYDPRKLSVSGINFLDLPFEDGSPPPDEVVERWFELLRQRFLGSTSEASDSCVAVHCVAGLGRAPVLVGIALIERGMKYEEAVELIRMRRRGALNQRQLSFLEHYKPRNRLSRNRSWKSLFGRNGTSRPSTSITLPDDHGGTKRPSILVTGPAADAGALNGGGKTLPAGGAGGQHMAKCALL